VFFKSCHQRTTVISFQGLVERVAQVQASSPNRAILLQLTARCDTYTLGHCIGRKLSHNASDLKSLHVHLSIYYIIRSICDQGTHRSGLKFCLARCYWALLTKFSSEQYQFNKYKNNCATKTDHVSPLQFYLHMSHCLYDFPQASETREII
jgi:hypothetical protein